MWNFNKYSNNIAVITEDEQKITYHQLDRMQSEFTSLLGTARELFEMNEWYETVGGKACDIVYKYK